MVETDPRILRRYEVYDEAARLRKPGVGELVRLRTWDIFHRFLPERGRLADVGGGPGVHAAHLAEAGYEVTLIDPVERHVEQARSLSERRFDVARGDARRLDLPSESFDAVLLMGPLYHLTEASDRAKALAEAKRVLKPGGTLLAEVITRHAWVLDATAKGIIDDPGVQANFTVNIEQGLSVDPDELADRGFWAYFHRVDEVEPELTQAGFDCVALVGVEGHAWLVANLQELLEKPEPLLQTLRLIEGDRSLLGVSAHVIAIATKP